MQPPTVGTTVNSFTTVNNSPLYFQVGSPQYESAVLKGLRNRELVFLARFLPANIRHAFVYIEIV